MTNGQDRPRRARLSDVARVAGVSLGAASKALSAPDAVRPSTLTAVRAAVEALGYVPSEVGRMLASRSTRMIGVVLPSFSHPIYAVFFNDLQDRLRRDGYLAVASSYDFDRALESERIEGLARRGVDGLVLIGAVHDPRPMRMIEGLGLPYVLSWAGDAAPAVGAVGFSDSDAMHAIVDHLVALGHRRFGMLNADVRGNERARWRRRGMDEALLRHGLELVDAITVPLTIKGGEAGFRALSPATRGIEAVVCSTDIIAAGALNAARLDGIDVPREVSVTGFDDIEVAELLVPALTTVRVPVGDLASLTARRIVALIQGGPPVPSSLIPTSMIIRQSTARRFPD